MTMSLDIINFFLKIKAINITISSSKDLFFKFMYPMYMGYLNIYKYKKKLLTLLENVKIKVTKRITILNRYVYIFIMMIMLHFNM